MFSMLELFEMFSVNVPYTDRAGRERTTDLWAIEPRKAKRKHSRSSHNRAYMAREAKRLADDKQARAKRVESLRRYYAIAIAIVERQERYARDLAKGKKSFQAIDETSR